MRGEKNLTLAFGGDSILYLSIPAFFSAAEKYNIEFEEIHCTGFSCIPAYFYLKTQSSSTSYLYSKKLYLELKKTFHFLFGLNLFGITEQLRTLYKASRSLNGFKSEKVLINFVDKFFVDEPIPEKLKIHAFNINTFNDEILKGSLKEALIKTLSIPIEFKPYNGYITGSWVYGIPEADFLFYIENENEYTLKNAVDYMIVSTIHRTKQIAKKRLENANHKIVINTKSKNPFEISTTILNISEKYLGGLINEK
ncbi:MAG: hypothetical protein PWQ83_560 [Thermosipho sp. (in: thermotogales)]|jgi:hypothetical protein|nr:hypothetical protein [Thermosipho sp. (in: thermotogales)]MDK2839025.1 hypothetical protein [Thermosipho sp. (in: thermotogales)]